MFEETDSYKSFKTYNLPTQNSYHDDHKNVVSVNLAG
jgi:hypothetical protein